MEGMNLPTWYSKNLTKGQIMRRIGGKGSRYARSSLGTSCFSLPSANANSNTAKPKDMAISTMMMSLLMFGSFYTSIFTIFRIKT
jgi:hypothetical protein